MRHIRLIGLISGFTLIELMVTISIMALLAVTAVPAFSRISAVNQLDNAAEEMKQMILEAQSLAMNPGNSCFGGSEVNLFKMTPTPPTFSLQIERTAEEGGICGIKEPNLLNTFSLNSGPIQLRFRIPDGKVNLTNYRPQNPTNLAEFYIKITSSKLEDSNNVRYVKLDVNTGKISITKTL